MDKVYRFTKVLSKAQAKNIYSFAKKIEIPNKISISKDYRKIEIQAEENSFYIVVTKLINICRTITGYEFCYDFEETRKMEIEKAV